MRPIAPTVKDVVLVGGGHSHVEVLRSFGKRPVAGARLTLVTKDLQTPYSGMLPGYVAGYYSYDEVHIDLCTLTRFAQSRLIHAEATGLDIKNRRVLFRNRPPLNYDVLSIDIGSTPKLNAVPGAKEHTTAVKPISTFIQRFHIMLHQTSPVTSNRSLPEEDDYQIRKMSGISLDLNRSSRSSSPGPSSEPKGSINRRSTIKRQLGQRGFCIVVVGGGAGGVELAFSIHHRLQNEVSLTPQQTISEPVVKLISRQEILMDYPPNVRSMILRNFEDKGIEVFEKNGVRDVKEGVLTLQDGERVEFDGCLWCTEASAAPWLRSTDLTIDEEGFIKINDFLQPFGGPGEVFAAGDIATSVTNPRPKAGVFAVRQGPILAKNIRRYLQGEELIPYIPQSTYLSLISTGDKHCIAHKGWFSWQGSALWKLKDTIDRLFMNKYSIDLPEFEERPKNPSKPKILDEAYASSLLEKQAAILSRESKLRCAGCGGKLGMNTLKNVLSKIHNINLQNTTTNHSSTENTINGHSETGDLVQEDSGFRGGSPPPKIDDFHHPIPTYDDAAVLQRPPEGYLMLQTTDMLKSFVSDPFLFGQITALHCLSDIYAMGGIPKTLLATAMVPFAAEHKMEADLIQLMSGAKKVCDEACCEIVGGHSCEGQDLSLGFSVLGIVQEGQQLLKTGLKSDQSLILTKPLGTGLILAAEMRRKAKAGWIQTMIETMLLSNDKAGEIFTKYEASACTDVTGFGLLGHMSEMMMSDNISVKIDSHSIPYLPGAEICAKSGILSSLFSQNSRVRDQIANFEAVKDDWRFRVLVDPQTSGGLLASVPKRNTEDCLKALQEAGYTSASLIGRTMDSRMDPSPMIHFNVEIRQ